ncbi:hypothetical protein IS481_11555 [Caldimonas thermodepolymerans]|jgi:hypothetical protein|uniref:Uncharacterized protein n=1 Tax=Caldimonas thermodepolymerans TaxID=215580 RepID=A0A2S5T202_9BURK|nr:hypothetical protein [Caldimonas thermodepolymerans]PPE68887.1 hypothetical protein C1702_14930 [Caldimonas thermodepolymerans]QPC30412.1 hypothetical protein IS481_11555 [Caldimonas thermodepolymerans]RDI03010.1 hypothetical protein DES46_102443 [Caldimonas thermodepolymerans]TCP08514.1 hypothetical protein EV676_10216 [Caldimonas thermodepolymerans]UZG46844.1 hypothetical protein ONS87_12905 [Caldimonas thermodepolymerans]
MDPTSGTDVYRRFESRSQFQDELRAAFELAATQGAREIWLCDVDYADWPLGERAVVDSLARWAHSHRRLRVLALHFDEIVRRHARWVNWRRDWAHIVECRSIENLRPEQVPRAWLAPGLHGVRLLDDRLYRGVAENRAASMLRAAEALDELWHQGTDAFPVYTLGL